MLDGLRVSLELASDLLSEAKVYYIGYLDAVLVTGYFLHQRTKGKK